MTNSSDLAFSRALDQAQWIRDGELSPLELTEVYLDRIERLDSQLGSFFTVAAEAAIADARVKTELLPQIADKRELPPFFGVPTAIKDLNVVAGLPVTYGIAALRQNVAEYDDGVVSRIKQAGFVILGKTATSQLGSFPYTEPSGFAPARNPWNLDYTPGGSSGGSAAAVAAGFCSVAQGSDGGGSIRGPAACCGVVGIKPSRGRVSNAPVGDYQSGISTNGPIARTVADAAAMLDVMSGYLPGDPYWLSAPEIPFYEEARRSLDVPLRIAFATTVPPFGESDTACQGAIAETAKRLEKLGHHLVEACPDVAGLLDPFRAIWQAGAGAAGLPLELLDPLNRFLGENSGSAGEYLQAVQKMQVISRQIVGFFENFDVLLLPVYRHGTIRIGEWAEMAPEEAISRIIEWVAPCPPFNASGLPAIALPAGFDDRGLPVGVQIVGRPAAEGLLIRLAAQLEADGLWSSDRRPVFS